LSATLFLREYILPSLKPPLLIAMSSLQRIFEAPQTAQDFLPLLRSWHEEAQQDEVWQKLRLVITYSTEAYLPLDIHQSPLNVGTPLHLPGFNVKQIMTLAQLHDLKLRRNQARKLWQLTGGNPRLVRIALYHLACDQMSLADVLQSATEPQGVFHNHLQHLIAVLRTVPELLLQLNVLVENSEPLPLDPVVAYRLESLGVIKFERSGWQISCNLYRDYLRDYGLSDSVIDSKATSKS
jgi:hypothetical protein